MRPEDLRAGKTYIGKKTGKPRTITRIVSWYGELEVYYTTGCGERHCWCWTFADWAKEEVK